MITTIIAAHMGSKRLPGKTLMQINGKTCLEHVVEAATRLNPVVATYSAEINRPIWELCRERNIDHYIYEGDGYDVLARFLGALERHRPAARWILRVTPDCPMLTKDLIHEFLMRCDFKEDTIYTNRPHDPDGTDLELFSVEMLKVAHNNAIEKSDREHVCPYIYRHYSVERISLFNNIVGIESKIKISIDELFEYNKVKSIMEEGNDQKMLEVSRG